jgi:hypothetical protein
MGKHLKILNNCPLTEKDLANEREPIRDSIIRSFKKINVALESYDYTLDEWNRKLADRFEANERFEWNDNF